MTLINLWYEVFWGLLHISPVDRAGPIFEISADPLIPLKKCPRVHMSGWSALVSETSVFPTGISGTRQQFFPHELLGSVTSDEDKKFIFLTESSYFFFFVFCDRENYEARTGAHIHLIQYNPGKCQTGIVWRGPENCAIASSANAFVDQSEMLSLFAGSLTHSKFRLYCKLMD